MYGGLQCSAQQCPVSGTCDIMLNILQNCTYSTKQCYKDTVATLDIDPVM